MSTTKEKIEVMQACVDGEEIESKKSKKSKKSKINEWGETFTPAWNWFEKDYRIKPKEPEEISAEDLCRGLGTAVRPLSGDRAAGACAGRGARCAGRRVRRLIRCCSVP